MKIVKFSLFRCQENIFQNSLGVLWRAQKCFFRDPGELFSVLDWNSQPAGLNISFMGRISELQTVPLNASSGEGGRRRGQGRAGPGPAKM